MLFLGHRCPKAVTAAGVTGAFVLLVVIACHILCLATPFFFTLSNSKIWEVRKQYQPTVPENFTFGVSYGLWMICVDGGPTDFQDKCFNIKSNASSTEVQLPDWLVAPRVLSLVGLLLAAAAAFSLVAFVTTKLDIFPHLFLFSAAVTSIAGGILILGSDIAFAAEKTIAFYGNKPMDSFLFPKNMSVESEAYLIQQYNNRFISGWSFILDLISGALCITVGPVFVFMVFRLQTVKEREDKQPLEKETPLSQEPLSTTSL